MDNLLPFSKYLAEKSSDILLSRFTDSMHTQNKSAGGLDIVTETDYELETTIKDLILKEFPSHGFWGEETGGEFKEYTWIVDPLDGTNNFGIGLAIAGTSIALVKNGEPILGIITYPFTKTYFIGIKGKGVYKSNIKTRYYLSRDFIDKKRLTTTIGNHIAASKQDYEIWLHKKLKLANGFNRVLDLWCTVAGFYLLFTNSLTGFISYKNEYYDLVAGYIIGKELGLNIIDLNGNPYIYKPNDYLSFIMTRYTDEKVIKKLIAMVK